MENLTIKNFGIIRDLTIDLKDLVIFIGETGTGKSTLAKLISIFRNKEFWVEGIFLEYLSYYQIRNFLQSSTFIEYQSEIGVFVYKEGKSERKFSENLLKKLFKYENNKELETKATRILEELIEYYCSEVIYIPAERSMVSFLAEKYAAIDRKELIGLFPPALLDFIGHFNKISSIIRRLPIDLFNVTYQKENGKDYIILSPDQQFLLSESASGLQTIVPAILIFEPSAQDEQKKSYTFEEPELNLFPTAQRILVELLAEKVLNQGHQVVITTHSPYILTALNNLLYAHQIGQKEPSKVEELIKRKLWLDPQNMVSYFVEEGTTRSIVDEELQQTKAEDIDEVSNLINSLYDKLLEIEVSGEDDEM
jgi:predicted ATPase